MHPHMCRYIFTINTPILRLIITNCHTLGGRGGRCQISILLIFLSVLNSLKVRKGDSHPSGPISIPGRESRVLGLVPTDIYVYKLIV